MSAASNWLNTDGQCREELHPYQARGGLQAVPSVVALDNARTRKLNRLTARPLMLGTVCDLVDKGMPVVAVIEIFKNAYTPGVGGMLVEPPVGERRRGLHAVLIVDLENSAEGRKIVFLNSWGASWGDQGFGRFSDTYFSKHCKQLWSV